MVRADPKLGVSEKRGYPFVIRIIAFWGTLRGFPPFFWTKKPNPRHAIKHDNPPLHFPESQSSLALMLTTRVPLAGVHPE